MNTRWIHNLLQLRKRLWAKPLLYCLFAMGASVLALASDYFASDLKLPEISPDTIESLLTIISSSMLAVATFAVGSMVSSYASASASGTPRAFALVLADDVSKTALSSFIGAFIFSIVSIVALKTGLYGRTGLFVLFLMTSAIFAWVILTFVRWVDNIARLGRLGTTIDKVETAALASLKERRLLPYLGGIGLTPANEARGIKIFCEDIGYVQFVDMKVLQSIAEANDLHIMVQALPGSFHAPGKPLVVLNTRGALEDGVAKRICNAFVIGDNRTFDDDPRFGLIVLSEISARALSPAVNDPGTAIVILGRFVRLFAAWAAPLTEDEVSEPRFDRVIVPPLALGEMFDDAFTATARDGAATVEVGIRLQKTLLSLAALDYPDMQAEARRHSQLALARAKSALTLEVDYARIERIAKMLD